MASQPEKIRLHQERERVLALGRLQDPAGAKELTAFLGSSFADVRRLAAKQRRTEGGAAVQSRGEKRIAEFLESEHIDYVYDERYRISGADLIRPDFYLPEFDVYIEYYGMDTPEYNENRRRKHVLYQRAAKKLISVSFKDDAELIEILKKKLSRYIRFEEEK